MNAQQQSAPEGANQLSKAPHNEQIDKAKGSEGTADVLRDAKDNGSLLRGGLNQTPRTRPLMRRPITVSLRGIVALPRKRDPKKATPVGIVRSVSERTPPVEVGLDEVFRDSSDADPSTTVSYHGGKILTNASIQLIFWGNAWTQPSNRPSAQEVINAVQNIISGPYMSALDQYDVGPAQLSGSTLVTDSEPPNPFSEDDVRNLVWACIDNGTFPEPDQPGGGNLYVIFMPPGSNYNQPYKAQGLIAGGSHSVAHDYDPPFSIDTAWYAWIGNSAPASSALDVMTSTFSHELVESCTDPELDAWKVDGAVSPVDEIGDVCASNDDLNGVYVQSYYSMAHHACIIPGIGGRVPHWNPEEDMGGGALTSAPTAASWSANRLDIFYRGPNMHLWHKSWAPGWSNEEDLGGILTSAPGAVSWGYNRIDIFYRGQNMHLWHKSWDGAKWNNEEDLGGLLGSDPSVASWGNNRLDIFYRGPNMHLWHKSWAPGWSNEEDLGGILTSAPGAVSWGYNRIDIFYRGQNDHLWHRSWDGAQWRYNDEDLGGLLSTGPTASAWSANRLDIFYAGQNNRMWHKAWDGAQWDDEEEIGGVLTTAPAAVSWGPNRIDCFYRGQNADLWHRSFS